MPARVYISEIEDMSEREAMLWLLRRWRQMEEHETDEWFMVDAKHVKAPHGGDAWLA